MSKIANADRSTMPARSRIARCSALMMGDHQRESHSCSRGSTASPYSPSRASFEPYHIGRSQPTVSKNTAPAAFSAAYIGATRLPRSLAHCSPGCTMP